MTLYQFLRLDSSMAFDVIDILRVIPEEFAFVLYQANELVCGSPLVQVRKDISSKSIKRPWRIVNSIRMTLQHKHTQGDRQRWRE